MTITHQGNDHPQEKFAKIRLGANIYLHAFVFFKFIEYVLQIHAVQSAIKPGADHLVKPAQLKEHILTDCSIDLISEDSLQIGREYYKDVLQDIPAEEVTRRLSQHRRRIQLAYPHIWSTHCLDKEIKQLVYNRRQTQPVDYRVAVYVYSFNPDYSSQLYDDAYLYYKSNKSIKFENKEELLEKLLELIKQFILPNRQENNSALNNTASANAAIALNTKSAKTTTLKPKTTYNACQPTAQQISVVFDLVAAQVHELIRPYSNMLLTTIAPESLQQPFAKHDALLKARSHYAIIKAHCEKAPQSKKRSRTEDAEDAEQEQPAKKRRRTKNSAPVKLETDQTHSKGLTELADLLEDENDRFNSADSLILFSTFAHTRIPEQPRVPAEDAQDRVLDVPSLGRA